MITTLEKVLFGFSLFVSLGLVSSIYLEKVNEEKLNRQCEADIYDKNLELYNKSHKLEYELAVCEFVYRQCEKNK